MNNTYFYRDKPIFGLDIGYSSLKVMQIDGSVGKKQVVSGYGVTGFDPGIIVDGVITNPEALAQAMMNLFEKNLIGTISTKRVCVSIPAGRTFTRTLTLPQIDQKDLAEAVRLETERYVPVPIDDLYLDYSVISKTDKGVELLGVAVPKRVVDSYVDLLNILGLDPVALETTIGASSRLFVQAEQSDVPTVLIDFGSLSADITVHDKGLVVTGTVPCGGDNFSQAIAKALNVTPQEAHIIKTKYGLGVSKKQKEITAALEPVLEEMLKEVRRVIRYYEERSGTERKINQVVTMGGGANMPGLSSYMTNQLRLAVRMCDPWQHLDFTGLQPPNNVEKSMYITVAGLSLTQPKEVFA
jgi:type IV pilus assembly protein PilM